MISIAKFLIVGLLIDAVVIDQAASAHEIIGSKNVNKHAACVPPFPMLDPLDQREYEDGLPTSERDWIRAVNAHLRKLPEKTSSLRYSRCTFGVEPSGEIVEPVAYSGNLTRAEKKITTELIFSFSPLPAVPVKARRQLIVGIDTNSITSIRICK
jgi:hypothetical protein